MHYELLDASSLEDRLVRVLDQKMSGMTSRAFEVYTRLLQQDAIMAVGDILDRLADILGPDILRARTQMGQVKLPMGPSCDSRIGRLEKGLDLATDPAMLTAIRDVAGWFVTDRDIAVNIPEFIVLNKDSNIGHPWYDTSAVHRLESFLKGIDIYERGLELTYEAFGGIRKQPDSTEKNEKGERVPKRRDAVFPNHMWDQLSPLVIPGTDLSLSVHDDFTFIKTVVSQVAPFSGPARVRGVKAMSYIDNSMPMVLRQTYLEPGEVSARIWKHRGMEDVFAKAKGRHVFCTDFSNFDQTVTDDEIGAMFDVWSMGWPKLAHHFEMVMDLCQHLKFTSADLFAPPMCEHRSIVYYRTTAEPGSIHGIISGLGLTDVIGKVIGAAFGVYVIRKLGYSVETKKEAEEYILNCGDDLVLMTPTSRDDDITRILEEQRFKKIRREDQPKFLGDEFVSNSAGVVVGMTPSVLSFYVNTMCPERQAGTGMRPFPEYGLSMRYKRIMEYMPDDNLSLLTREFYARLTAAIPDYDALVEEQTRDVASVKDVQYLLEKYGLQKIEEIYYRLTTKDLPKEDAELIGILVPMEEIIKRAPSLTE